jgi:hypothetical protein
MVPEPEKGTWNWKQSIGIFASTDHQPQVVGSSSPPTATIDRAVDLLVGLFP